MFEIETHARKKQRSIYVPRAQMEGPSTYKPEEQEKLLGCEYFVRTEIPKKNWLLPKLGKK